MYFTKLKEFLHNIYEFINMRGINGYFWLFLSRNKFQIDFKISAMIWWSGNKL
ncbi:hypothetical protein RCH13_000913 [Chryseobacterium sp. MP_3.2]|nr:hypothetical protein [Chryseobacterium sp. MP_3.2]